MSAKQAKQQGEERPEQVEQLVAVATPADGYLAWSRDPAVAVLGVLPLWLLYELLRLNLAPEERNGAEALVTESLQLLGPNAMTVMRIVMGVVLLFACGSVLRRQVPWARVAAVAALEGSVYGLLLGPITAVLTLLTFDKIALSVARAADLVGSLGAGVFEEALFRLVLLSLLSLVLTRVCEAFSMPKSLGVVLAVVLSALAFSGFHHIGGGGEVFNLPIFAFRAVAGFVLGWLFVLRGFCVVVYTHAVYDLHYYLTHDPI